MKSNLEIPKHIKSEIYKYNLVPITDELIDYLGYNKDILYRIGDSLLKIKDFYIFRIKSHILTIGIIDNNNLQIFKHLTTRFSEGSPVEILKEILSSIFGAPICKNNHYTFSSEFIEISLYQTDDHYSVSISNKRKEKYSSHISHSTYIFSNESNLNDSILDDILKDTKCSFSTPYIFPFLTKEIQDEITKYKDLIEDLQNKLTDEEFISLVEDNIEYVNLYRKGEADVEIMEKIYKAFREAVHNKEYNTLKREIESKEKELENAKRVVNKIADELDDLNKLINEMKSEK